MKLFLSAKSYPIVSPVPSFTLFKNYNVQIDMSEAKLRKQFFEQYLIKSSRRFLVYLKIWDCDVSKTWRFFSSSIHSFSNRSSWKMLHLFYLRNLTWISSYSHVELSLRNCKDLWANFPWGSVKIVPLLRKDNCRSVRIFTDVQRFSVQISQEFFSGPSSETMHFIF